MREPHDACKPFTQLLSMTAIGTPRSDDDEAPFEEASRRSLSNSSARATAPARSICRNELSVSLRRSAAPTAATATARAVVAPDASSDEITSTVLSVAVIGKFNLSL